MKSVSIIPVVISYIEKYTKKRRKVFLVQLNIIPIFCSISILNSIMFNKKTATVNDFDILQNEHQYLEINEPMTIIWFFE